MCFIFVMSGWEGSAHDDHIFKFYTCNRYNNFSMTPPDKLFIIIKSLILNFLVNYMYCEIDKYYLMGASYPIQWRFLKSFLDTIYHFQFHYLIIELKLSG